MTAGNPLRLAATAIDAQTIQQQIAHRISHCKLAVKTFGEVKPLHFRHDRDHEGPDIVFPL